MTGEVTLRGHVLPVGGTKEKVLAAHRGGVTTVLIPSRNRQDVLDVPQDVLKQLTVYFVETVWEVMELVFDKGPSMSVALESSVLRDHSQRLQFRSHL